MWLTINLGKEHWSLLVSITHLQRRGRLAVRLSAPQCACTGLCCWLIWVSSTGARLHGDKSICFKTLQGLVNKSHSLRGPFPPHEALLASHAPNMLFILYLSSKSPQTAPKPLLLAQKAQSKFHFDNGKCRIFAFGGDYVN